RGIFVLPFHLDSPGTVRVMVMPDSGAEDRSGFALTLTNPYVVAATAALGQPPTSGTVLGASTPLRSGSQFGSDESPRPPGPYRLSAACAGVGTVTVTLTIGDQTGTTTLTCGRHQPPSSIQLTTTTDSTETTVLLEPDEVAKSNDVGAAYRLDM